MRSTVIISINPRFPGGCYEISIVKQNGKTLTGLQGGWEKDLGEVAGRAAMYALEHCARNPMGGDIVGPTKILNLIPQHLHHINSPLEE